MKYKNATCSLAQNVNSYGYSATILSILLLTFAQSTNTRQAWALLRLTLKHVGSVPAGVADCSVVLLKQLQQGKKPHSS